MKKILLLTCSIFLFLNSQAQTDPAIITWLQNTTETGSYYVEGNSTVLDNEILYNCQSVEYSDDFVYVSTNGIPSYPTGPFLDGNPSFASSQDALYKFPLNPVANTGTASTTTAGSIGIFINGVSLYDYRDGVAWNPNTNNICGGPGNASCPGGPGATNDWNRDAIPAELGGFDCSKGHPAMGDYHHHQNPSALKLDLEVISDICTIYDADGLYAIDAAEHSPLIGFAYDGFPIYGAYGYQNGDGTGEIVRIKSGYQVRDITARTEHADGTNVDDGPDVSDTYFLGYFREDYEFISHPGEDDYLDEHNGRLCVTPEYPDGTYAYFATVDENWNSTYPYIVGPTFYGDYENRSVTSIDETTTIYVPTDLVDNDNDGFYSDEDCDDNNAAINPDAVEIANNDVDEDCDGIALIIDADNDGYNSDEDCDDNNAAINPDAVEIANNDVDEDCDGIALIIDADNDGYNSDEDCDDSNAAINPAAVEVANNDIDEDCDGIALIIDADNDGYNSDEDCDDSNAAINPDAVEVVNNDVDEDCDGIALVIDADNDGYNSDEDCDDSNAAINPAAVEVVNNDVDEDCDGIALVIDVDNDGYNSDEDCDDTDAAINPGAIEISGNGIDEDCDGFDLIVDNDNDGFDSNEDCDDSNAAINPDAIEIANNDVDENCDGIILIIDEDNDGYNSDEDCDDTNAAINPAAVEVANNDIDEDCDGIALIIDEDNDGYNSDEDCDDTNSAINPAAVEVANNDIDEDCDGIALIIDEDNDGYNSDEDCDDTNSAINPAAVEVANNDIDEDCDGIALIIDEDNDGYNSDEDCDDMNAEINPDADEIPNNGIDEDCDGEDLVSSIREQSENKLNVFPNPASDLVTLQVSGLLRNKLEISIYDELGRLIKETSINQGSTISVIDVQSFYTGRYVIRIQDGTNTYEQLLIIVRD